MSTVETQLAVIGAGPGGYAAAFHAADLGFDVTMIDPERNPGGVCLYRGCIPSKALLHVAKLLADADAAVEFGVDFGEPDIALEKLRDWKDDVVADLTRGLGQLTDRRGVRKVRGTAAFASEHELVIESEDGPDRIRFEHAIIATGSHPIDLDPFPYGWDEVLDSTDALDLPTIPRTLLVVGGGYIGLEMATVYAALGSKVTVVEATSEILRGVDRDLVRPLELRLKSVLEDLFVEQEPAEPSQTEDGVEVTLTDGDEPRRATFERVLVAVGRAPRTGDLGLEKAHVDVEPGGTVGVNAMQRTSVPSIYAIGDVTGGMMLAHVARYEGRVAVEAIAGEAVAFDPRAVPAVVYTDPEIAWCGLTEGKAAADGTDVEVVKFPWAASGRALTMGRRDGVTKLIVDPGNGRILGAGVCGPHAGELIAEAVLAIEMGATATDLELTVHPHPTLSETWMEAAESVFGESIHFLGD